ncbi:hypothetical protein [Rhodospirillaceae bacterium SYSU D60014]|uniref:hypothetical protein n=1 Tax=Virgifigura deserti TaxID=2268457 RepID=UPI000E668417
METEQTSSPSERDEERRRFLERFGKYAIVTPPAITMMLAVALTPDDAVASGFPGVGWGVGGNPKTKTPGQHPGGKP